mmetsp:Transcript_14885/g.31930  ORF Transcript_14885/g.31930 Transcript_14885/m.31930 type:complete len:267 (+) Transcript_14885:231-1031(+)|eukprot:CAMPEP_0185849798 /NCGR_PEP_ID=MMETSP1354-20130828/4185_1 /TAXON_ID=708628 /ORGANISM="Erythrolobus madagascarensis, Strain CCMP3276" /LENGTH=266 /DNA_ID=CAMNT_0028550401 /DNA_START=185 /DNA_END=985 /DNA_ORIENTATION=+
MNLNVSGGAGGSAALVSFGDANPEADKFLSNLDEFLACVPWEAPPSLPDVECELNVSLSPQRSVRSLEPSTSRQLSASSPPLMSDFALFNPDAFQFQECTPSNMSELNRMCEEVVSSPVVRMPSLKKRSSKVSCTTTDSGGDKKPHGGSRKKRRVEDSNQVERKTPAPSRFCHICWRVSSNTELYTCALYTSETNRCRKVECERCILAHCGEAGASSAEQALNAAKEGTRRCLHCRGECPERAQCKFYTKSNARRRALREMRKSVS